MNEFPSDRDDWFPLLHQWQWEPMVRLATLLLGDQEQAEQAVVAAFATAWRRDPRLRSREHAVSYLRTGVVNKVRGRRPVDPSDTAPAHGDPGELAYWCLRGLPARQREVLVLKLFCDLTEEETAETLGMSVNGVRSNERKGLMAVGDVLRPGSETSPGRVDPRVEAVMRSSLEAVAESVTPGSRYQEILDARVSRRRRPRRWVVAVASAVALGVGLALPLLGRSHEGFNSSDSASVPVAVPSAAQGSLATLQTDVKVFYLGREDGLIHRELRDLPTSGDRLGTAVGAVLNVAPLNPDYSSGWSAGQVNSASVNAGRITLDLSASAFSQFTNREQEERAIQQLVVTATAAVGDRTGEKSVRILVDGSPNLPIMGKPPTDFVNEGLGNCAAVWVDTPQSGATVKAGALAVSGVAQQSVSAMTWQLRAAKGSKVVSNGAVSLPSSSADKWRPWQASINVTPGEWELVILAGNHVADSRTISVE